MKEQLVQAGMAAKKASFQLMNLSSAKKDHYLVRYAERLEEEMEKILTGNREDCAAAREGGMRESLLDRLSLDEKRVLSMAQGLRQLVSLKDPVGEVVEGVKRPNGLLVQRVRVPLGVIAIIYEARPNVTVDSIGLGMKSGNACILRGSRSALRSNRVLAGLARETLRETGIDEGAVTLLDSESHQDVHDLLTLREYIDVAIPRGGEHLIRSVVENSVIPVIETGVGNCHVYIDRTASLAMSLDIVVNAKTQRPSVCNALETLLVDEAVAEGFLPTLARALLERGVKLRGCARTCTIVPEASLAEEEDWWCEYLDLVLAVKIVRGLQEAVEHINHYGSKHSEAIITADYMRARRFLDEVDAAAVYVNASTRFTDGEQFGMGAEIGISTQKLHARGPMGLRELTTSKFVVYGTGQVRE